MDGSNYNLVVVLGPTASGKTSVAAHFAFRNRGEIISADSRQIYRRMDLGTGKDLSEYTINGHTVPYHLINIREPGYQYNVYEYQNDFITAFREITQRKHLPVLCGGTALYIDAVLRNYRLHEVPPDPELRSELEKKNTEELIRYFSTLQKPHNTTDFDTRKRLIRAIEIAVYNQRQRTNNHILSDLQPLVIGIRYPRSVEMVRIRQRMEQRIRSGMIEEVEQLLKTLTPEQLMYYGLEYKYITLYLTGKMKLNEMKELLNIAIRQFAKRQMTWFRKMEREGTTIHWLNGELSLEEKVEQITSLYIKSCH